MDDYAGSMNNASLRHLRCFIAVAEEGSFARAAHRLGLTQSALSAAIKGAEAALGAALFHRTTRRVELTTAAAGFLPMARTLLQDFDTAVAMLRSHAAGEGGHVRIATATSVMTVALGPVIRDFAVRLPGVRFTIRDGVSSDIQQRVLLGEADIGFTSRWQDDPALAFQPMLRDDMGVVVAQGHALAADASPIRWDQLAGWPYLALTFDTGTRVMLQASAPLPPPQHEVSTFAMLAELLKAGHGFSIVPALFGSLPVTQGLVFRRLVRPVITREICLITRRGRELPAAARAFLAELRQRLRRTVFPPGVQAIRAGRSLAS